jgi:hypothetical protein
MRKRFSAYRLGFPRLHPLGAVGRSQFGEQASSDHSEFGFIGNSFPSINRNSSNFSAKEELV